MAAVLNKRICCNDVSVPLGSDARDPLSDKMGSSSFLVRSFQKNLVSRVKGSRREGFSWRAWIHALCWVALGLSCPVEADIYRYIDSEGTMHFTNVPIHADYEVYIREAAPRKIHPSSRYDRYIAEAVSKYDVPFSLVKAVIKAESNFDPRAVSCAGACGLMQLMPETAKDLGVEDAFDPRENILAGVRYLKGLLDRFQGSIPLALAAYNAGPERIGPLREIPQIVETQSYVQRVMEYFYSY